MVEVDVEDRLEVTLISVILGGFAMDDYLYDIVEREANDDGLDCGMSSLRSTIHTLCAVYTENWPHKKSKILNTQTPTETGGQHTAKTLAQYYQ